MKKNKVIIKPWGYEELISHNKKYVLKKLMMKKVVDAVFSIIKKHETIYVLTGSLKILIGKKKNTLKKKS